MRNRNKTKKKTAEKKRIIIINIFNDGIDAKLSLEKIAKQKVIRFSLKFEKKNVCRYIFFFIRILISSGVITFEMNISRELHSYIHRTQIVKMESLMIV